MSSANKVATYLNNHYEGMTPEKLIQLLFKAALKHISLAREGIEEKDPKKRGEHLGKVIAIVTELHSNLDPTMNDESTKFLRGLYSSILIELPKVSITNDIKTIDLTYTYMKKLSTIWDNECMNQQKSQLAKPVPNHYGAFKNGTANTEKARSFFA